MPEPQDPHQAAPSQGLSRAHRPGRAAAPDAESLFSTEERSPGASNAPTVRIKARRTGDLADVFAAGDKFGPLSVSDLAALELTDGSPWTEGLRARVELAVHRRACLRKAMTLLAARPRSERELLDRLATSGYEAEVAAGALATLRVQGLVNDAAIAESIVEKATRRGDAKPGLERELARRGVNITDHLTGASVAPDAADEAAATGIARSLVAGRGNGTTGPSLMKQRRKVYAALLRRGFDEETAERATSAVLGDPPEDQPRVRA